MGSFSNRVKGIFNKRPISSIDVVRGKVPMSVGRPMTDEEQTRCYCLRSITHPTQYVHFFLDRENNEQVYYLYDGVKGACFWLWNQAQQFIKATGRDDLEMIRFDMIDKKEL